VRRLPGPARWRLSEGDHTPEALCELFRDWQRTQTQSSVTALRSSRPQMDVWFCSRAGTIRREAYVRNRRSRSIECALSRARLQTSRFLLTTDLHGCRLFGSNERGIKASVRKWHHTVSSFSAKKSLTAIRSFSRKGVGRPDSIEDHQFCVGQSSQ
jgi:hypothetical protein